MFRKHLHSLVGPCGVCDTPPPTHDGGCGCILVTIFILAAIALILVSMSE